MDEIQKSYNQHVERLRMRNEEIANLKKSYDLKPKQESREGRMKERKQFKPKDWSRLHEKMRSRDIKEKKESIKAYKKSAVGRVEKSIEKYGKKRVREFKLSSVIKKMRRPTVVVKIRPYHSNFFREEFSQGGQ